MFCSSLFTYRVGELVSNKYNVDEYNDVTSLTSAAERQHLGRCQRSSSTVLIKSSGQRPRRIFTANLFVPLWSRWMITGLHQGWKKT